MRNNIRAIVIFVAALFLFSGVLTSQEGKRFNPRDYLSQEKAEAGNAQVTVRGVGVFKIDKVGLRPGGGGSSKKASCQLHIPTVQSQIADWARKIDKLEEGTGSSATLAASECTDDDGTRVLCCIGNGSTCSYSFKAIRLF